MTSRFQLISEEDLKKLSEIAENQNTKKGTNDRVKIYKQWSNGGRTLQNNWKNFCVSGQIWKITS